MSARASLRIAALGVAALGAAHPGARAAAADESPPVWIAGPDGVRFRVRFDPGQRLIFGVGLGAGLGGDAGAAAPAAELGLLLRSERPAPGWDVYWKRDHEIARLRFQPGEIDGALYRGLYLRQSRAGTLTLPTTPPLALALPFDIGLLAEVGRFQGAPVLESGGPGLRAGVIHGEALADFWRSHHAGRWLMAGVGGRYDVGLTRDAGGVLRQDHVVSPMTTLSLAVHGEQRDGLLAGGLRVEGAHRWSSQRGWEQAFRVEADAEAVPIALNDRPVSLFATARVDGAGGLPLPEARVLVGLRVSEPLSVRTPGPPGP